MKTLQYWRPYLRWTKEPFTILTDHANLQYWKALQNLTRWMARWHTDLQEYDYILWHIPGKTNILLDFLSWPPDADKGANDNKGVTMIPPEWIHTASIIDIPLVVEVRRGLMNLYHNHPLAGHPGQDKMLWQVQEWYQWPGMKEWITDYVKGCAMCQQNKILTHRAKNPLY